VQTGNDADDNPASQNLRQCPQHRSDRLLRGVDNCQDVDLVRLDVVNDPVRPFEDFADLAEFELRNRTSGLWKLGDLLRSSAQAVNDAERVIR